MTTRKIRCAVVGSFTVDPLVKEATRSLGEEPFDLDWWIAPFGTYWRVMLDETSDLYKFAPEIVFVVVAAEDLTGSDSAANQDTVGNHIEQVRSLSQRLPNTTVVAATFSPSSFGQERISQFKSGGSHLELVSRANLALSELAHQQRNVFLADVAAELSLAGISNTFDARYYYAAGMRLNSDGNRIVGALFARFIRAMFGIRKKCVVLDLDGTLWGGIVGEVGPEGIVLGLDGAGKAYQDFQTQLKKLQLTGVLLAIVSKNNREIAIQAIEDHPAMVLREDDFVSLQINWDDKAQNIIQVAADLNIALDSVVFLDDSPYERERVRSALPDVVVPDLPDDPADYPLFLQRLQLFDTLTVTNEDTGRTKLYSEERRRREIRETAGTLDDFLRGLGLKVSVRPPAPHEVSRFSQLTQRTNQFNLTTRRYTESEIGRLIEDPNKVLLVGSSEDRVGSNGIVGAAIVDLHPESHTAEIDTFLMSCRVLGRGVELAIMSALLQWADTLGLHEMHARFIRSDRNKVAEGFLEKCGFSSTDGDEYRRATNDWRDLVPGWVSLELDQKVPID